ncbi:MAG TPA: NAD(P)/FAD-dependent oxidoreductase [Myxococcales bacterium]|nr:NAD(P)/FAD-dependent oxidoreductase [Myxococcales bacterium]
MEQAVILENGEELSADAVVSSCDPNQTFRHLLGPERVSPTVREDAGHVRMRGNIAKIHLALNAPLNWAARPGERFERVRIADSMTAYEKAFDASKYNRLAETPCLDLNVATVNMPELAPQGHESVSILVHFVPHQLDGGWTETSRKELSKSVLQHLATYTFGLSESLVGIEVLTPEDLEASYGLTGGHLFHGEHALDQLLSLRPFAGCYDHATPVDSLFMCGGGTHPGGGISGRPGKLGADAVLRTL